MFDDCGWGCGMAAECSVTLAAIMWCWQEGSALSVLWSVQKAVAGAGFVGLRSSALQVKHVCLNG